MFLRRIVAPAERSRLKYIHIRVTVEGAVVSPLRSLASFAVIFIHRKGRKERKETQRRECFFVAFLCTLLRIQC